MKKEVVYKDTETIHAQSKIKLNSKIQTPQAHNTFNLGPSGTMIAENQQLVTNEPVEFEKKPVEVQDCRLCTDHFRGIYKIYPNLKKDNHRLSTLNWLDLQTLGSQPIMLPENLPDHCSNTISKLG